MKIVRTAFFLLAGILLHGKMQAQMNPQELPVDSSVRIGQLANGLRYYIRHNEFPKDRVDFYIAQKVGSILEEENQRGLAHFLEHMCFNGTRNFPGNQVIRYCESLGVQFGSNLNAYTSIDETVYNICNVPTTRISALDSCLLILHDWAGGLLLEPKEINKERGVIHEEWRLQSSAIQRILERNLPLLYPDSRYGHRMPIGLMSVIDNFKPETLRAYYEKWYRPDLQGIIVVGDIDVDHIEKSIQRIFSPIKMPQNPKERIYYEVTDNANPIVVVDKDKEQSSASISIMFKYKGFPKEKKNSKEYFEDYHCKNMICSILNERLEEISLKPNSPFTSAFIYDSDYLMSKAQKAISLAIRPKNGKDAEAVKVCIEEIVRGLQHGFSPSEYNRSQKQMISSLDRIYMNRDKQKNDFYAEQYIRHFLDKEPIPSLEDQYHLLKDITSLTPIEQVNKEFRQLIDLSGKNKVIIAIYPEKEGISIPSEKEILKAMEEAFHAQTATYEDKTPTGPLFSKQVTPGKIKRERHTKFGYTEWELNNGIKVYWRQTDFKDNEILMRAESAGGISLLPDSDIINAHMVNAILDNNGLGNYTSLELQKVLAGSQVYISPFLNELSEGFSGGCTPNDIKTLLELTHLYFSDVKYDPENYNSYIESMKNALENTDKQPETIYSDSIINTVYNHNPRKKRITRTDIDKMNYNEILRIYKERFANPADFTFFFTGKFQPDSLRHYVEAYLGSLPTSKQREHYRDNHVYPRMNLAISDFKQTMESPKAFIFEAWSGQTPLTLQKTITVNALSQALTMIYMERIRENAGWAYTIQTDGRLSKEALEYYLIQTTCPVKPEKCDSALLVMEQVFKEIGEKGVDEKYLDKIKKYNKKTSNDQLRENSYWQSLIRTFVMRNIDLYTEHQKKLEKLSSEDIRKFVKDIVLKQNNRIITIMRPQTGL